MDGTRIEQLLPRGAVFIKAEELADKPKHAKCERIAIVYAYNCDVYRAVVKKDILYPKRLSKVEKNEKLAKDWRSSAEKYWDN